MWLHDMWLYRYVVVWYVVSHACVVIYVDVCGYMQIRQLVNAILIILITLPIITGLNK